MSGTNRLGITAGVFGSLALAVSASADFTCCQIELQGTYDTASAFAGPDVGLVEVWNLYALFSDPDDQYIKTFVDDTDASFDELVLSSDATAAFDGFGNGFWNWSLGANTPLAAGPVHDLDPAAANADTYLTIRLKAGFPNELDDPTVDAAFFTAGSESILNASGLLTSGGSICVTWEYTAAPNDAQTFPIDGRVLVLQFAVLSGEHASGVWNIEWINVAAGTGGRDRCEWTTVPGDSDGDGVPDDVDCQPNSDLSATVVIDGCDSMVPNVLFGNGCTILDLICFCADEANNHGQFVNCVAQLTNDLERLGIISRQEKGAILRCAAQANLPCPPCP